MCRVIGGLNALKLFISAKMLNQIANVIMSVLQTEAMTPRERKKLGTSDEFSLSKEELNYVGAKGALESTKPSTANQPPSSTLEGTFVIGSVRITLLQDDGSQLVVLSMKELNSSVTIHEHGLKTEVTLRDLCVSDKLEPKKSKFKHLIQTTEIPSVPFIAINYTMINKVTNVLCLFIITKFT